MLGPEVMGRCQDLQTDERLHLQAQDDNGDVLTWLKCRGMHCICILTWVEYATFDE